MFAGVYYGQIPYAGNTSYVPYTYTPATGALKNKDMWSNNDIKTLQSWINVTKAPTYFHPVLSGGVYTPYTYDNATMTYDNGGVFYDTIYTASGNQINSLVPTTWKEEYV